MSSPLFDTLDAAEALTGAGPTEAQARAIVAAMRKAVSDNVATKGDVAELRGELGAVKGPSSRATSAPSRRKCGP